MGRRDPQKNLVWPQVLDAFCIRGRAPRKAMVLQLSRACG